MDSFPNSHNELPLIFSLYSNLIQTQNIEKSVNDMKSLFERYSMINREIFNISEDSKSAKFTEGSIKDLNKESHFSFSMIQEVMNDVKKKKNYRLVYLLFYYSILLTNENNLPYPKFLFVHDRLRQHFGGFRTVISKGDIEKYDKNDNDKIQYKSEVFTNEIDLECSCYLINIFETEKRKKNAKEGSTSIRVYHEPFNIFDDTDQITSEKVENKYDICKIFIHQLKNDQRIELPQNGQKVQVSFPLEIIVFDSQTELKEGEAFVIDFSASKAQEEDYFNTHFEDLQEDFEQFISLADYDDELSKIVLANKKREESEIINNIDDDNDIDDDDYIDSDDDNNQIIPHLTFGNIPIYRFSSISSFLSFHNSQAGNGAPKKKKENRDDFRLYEIEKIPMKITVNITNLNMKAHIISLRYSILSNYSHLVESMMVSYSDEQNNFLRGNSTEDSISWNIPLSSKDKLQNIYTRQIIRPAFSMNTELKFKFIHQIFMSESKGKPQLKIVFNRFEQQKFMDKFNNKNKNDKNNKARPLFVQFMEQVDECSLPLLKVHSDVPFKSTLVGENAIDAGGPGRELFSSLIMEMMSEHDGIFTYNPNRRHCVKDTNQEDLIPNKFMNGEVFKYEGKRDKDYFNRNNCRFKYAGALIAACIVSDLPQPMTLSSFIWEYLSVGRVEIGSIYEIDHNFKELIENAEQLLKKSVSLSEEQFESLFLRAFDINDSFDNVVELVPSGSKKRVTKDNLKEFIELAKNFRVHEFDQQLHQLKTGFEIVMSYKNITSILHPNELKLLACGETNCSVEQMKKLIVVAVMPPSTFSSDSEKVQYNEKMVKMFWNVMESFSIEERMLFIRFSSGNMGLPAPGLKWDKDLKVNILSREETIKNKQKMAVSHTCFSSVDIPFFESEEEIGRILRASINFSGLITDSTENPEAVFEFT